MNDSRKNVGMKDFDDLIRCCYHYRFSFRGDLQKDWILFELTLRTEVLFWRRVNPGEGVLL